MANSRPAPTTGQGVFGVGVLLGFAVIAVWWSVSETGGARTFLLLLAAMFIALAAVRGFTTFRLAARTKKAAGS